MRAPHEVLGVAPNATPDAIKQAYRRLSMKEHPDRNKAPGASERFQEIQAAYATLSGKPAANSAAAASGFSGSWGDGVGMESLFEHLFAQQQSRPRVRFVEVVVPWRTALLGGDHSVPFEGTGRVWAVRLPAGLAHGDRIPVPAPPGQTGSWAWIVHVPNPEGFRREGNDIHGVLRVPAFRAALGGAHRWDLWEGAVDLTLPSGTQPGQVFRLAGRGAVHPNDPRRGDLYAHVTVSVPDKLTASQRTALAEWLGDAPPAKRRRRKSSP